MGVTRFPEATNRQVDFNSSGTWTCPAGVYSAKFLVVGAGGAGGGVGNGGATQYVSGGGGGGGAVKLVDLAVTPGTSYTITIGAKGTGAAASAGGNGSFTEVLNGAIVLIRALGGRGGEGYSAAGALLLSTSAVSVASGAGEGALGTSPRVGGGGGGAASIQNYYTSYSGGSDAFGIEGSAGYSGSTSGSATTSPGGVGINGYGAGGGGGISTATSSAGWQGNVPYGSGAGAYRTTTGASAGGSATISGCGGGGAASHTTTTTAAGGNGSDGLVRVVYFA